MSLGQVTLLLKNGSQYFSEIVHKARGCLGLKIDEAKFFTEMLIFG